MALTFAASAVVACGPIGMAPVIAALAFAAVAVVRNGLLRTLAVALTFATAAFHPRDAAAR